MRCSTRYATLDERDREIIALRFFADLSEAETAVAAGCALGTAKSHLSLPKERLRERLELAEVGT